LAYPLFEDAEESALLFEAADFGDLLGLAVSINSGIDMRCSSAMWTLRSCARPSR